MHWPVPRTLFSRTALLMLVLMLVFQLFTLAVTSYFILLPVVRGSVNNLAALMVRTSRDWQALAPAGRMAYQRELGNDFGLWLQESVAARRGVASHLPYVLLLNDALSRRLAQPVAVYTNLRDENLFQVDIPAAGRTLHFEFTRERIGTRPSLAMLLVFAAGVLSSLVASIILARRLTRPLGRLARATTRFGFGQMPEPIPETGPRELASLAHNFNQMVFKVRELLDNRTILLAGVSHDLRTPIARLRVALELLRSKPDQAILDNMERYLEELNALIAQFLEYGQGIQAGECVPTDLVPLLAEMVVDARAEGVAIEWQGVQRCEHPVEPVAVQRIVRNLLENAIRYSAGQGVVVCLQCEDGSVSIEVRDRGPGIAPDQRERVFQPFVRLEQSRSAHTGGTGLGLAIARQIAQSYGWSLTLHDRAGGGTTARLVLTAAVW
jgi:two-component system, OmpR family, osmolarity sensor histidine kinase EnvZ